MYGYGSNSFSVQTNMLIDATNEKIAIKYYPSATSPITDIAARISVTGNPGSFKFGVFANTYASVATGTPDDTTQLGDWSTTFDLAATGWTSLLALATNTGNLTNGTPVWIVMAYASGTCDVNNYIQSMKLGAGLYGTNKPGQRHFNGTDWTTTTALTDGQPLFIVKHADGTYAGAPVTAILARTGAPDIFSSNKQGIRFKCGSQVKIQGVEYYLTKTGAPNNLTWSIYEGDTLKYSQTELAADVLSITSSVVWFDTPILLAADTYLYIILSQTGNDTNNDYDLQTWTIDFTYIDAIATADLRAVYGTSSTPSGLTVSNSEIAWCFPIISDLATDLDMSAGGGNSGPWGMIR